MDSLQEIMGKKNFTPPDEMAAVKDYIKRRYNSFSRVKLERDVLIVSVPSAALAATLHLEKNKIIRSCSVTKKLVFRTGR
jgi:hypothetical protein